LSSQATVLNGRFDALTAAQTVDSIFDLLRHGGRGWLCTVNVSTLMTMRRDAWLQAFVDRARWVVADGQPLVWCARLFGPRIPERVAGVDLLDALCARAVTEHRIVYCLGATLDHLDGALVTLRQRHPGLVVHGRDGYFATDDATAVAEAIRASGATILLVGMGTPRQERFIEQQWARLGSIVAIGVGGSFDVIAGRRVRAPRWARTMGLEWLVRLAQEPRRLLVRYISTNSHFCLLILHALFVRVGDLILSERR
jgi:N-acetylglucosaminyldiphosphoundecaprenol N-acetyl-beta-D-mannosaminyltransferase